MMGQVLHHITDAELAELPLSVVNELSTPIKARALAIMKAAGLRPVVRGSPGKFRISEPRAHLKDSNHV